MQQFKYIIKDAIGIHARPATILAKEAKNFESVITIAANGKEANVRAMIKLMSMAVKQGNEVIVTAEGLDETKAIKKMEEIFKYNL